MTLKSLFTEHPASVDESYLEHMGAAASFAFWFQLAAIAAIVHAIFPFLFVKTGSQIVTRLHDRMVTNRRRLMGRRTEPSEGLWQAFDSAAL